MTIDEKVLFGWSGGKDSAMALYELQQSGGYTVSALLTTLTDGYDRISMHGVPRILLERQVESLNLKLEKIYISKNATNEEYESKMAELAHRFVDLEFKAVITCVDSQMLGKEFVGRFFDKQFLSELPASVDACGDNGEFHSFVYDGPIFRNRVSHALGEIVLRDNRFYYCDLLPQS